MPMSAELSGSLGIPRAVPNAREQARAVRAVEGWTKMHAGDTWHVLDHQWWSDWQAYVGYGEASSAGSSLVPGGFPPGPIENSKLLLPDDEFCLRGGLVEASDFTLVPHGVWRLLVSWYGGGPSVRRMAVEVGHTAGFVQVELYPFKLTVEKVGSFASRMDLIASQHETVREFLFHLCSCFWLPPTTTKLFLEVEEYNYVQLEEMDARLGSFQMVSGQRLFLDAIRFDGSYEGPPVEPVVLEKAGDDISESEESGDSDEEEEGDEKEAKSTFLSSTRRNSGQTAMWKDSNEPAAVKGATGLVNLGNTCFMSSSIQCLAHLPAFAALFLADEEEFNSRLNGSNTMGTGGKLAKEFSQLVKKLCSGKLAYAAPWQLKAALAEFAPQFAGFRQHDAQELVAYLLDGLHEDLNEVVEKKYFADQLVHDGTVEGVDEEMAKETWARHLARDCSLIVRTFDGLLRSKLHCPGCDRVSITFDPFRFLSVPLPRADRCHFQVTLLSKVHHWRPRTYLVDVSIHGVVGDVHRSLARMAGVPFGSLLFANEQRRAIKAYVRNDRKGVGALEAFENIVAYETLVGYAEGEEETAGRQAVDQRVPEGHVLLQFLFRKLGEERQVELVGMPLVQAVKRTATHSDVAARVQEYLQKHGGTIVGEEYEAVSEGSPKTASETMYDFSLRLVTPAGRKCGKCKASSNCTGCALEEVGVAELPTNLSIAVDLYRAVNFAEAEEDVSMEQAASREPEKVATVTSCIDLFLEEETLAVGQEWYCPCCKAHVLAAKKLDLWKLPRVLIIHLKRFYHLQGSNKKGKVTDTVEYPEVITVQSMPQRKAGGARTSRYRLLAVCNHIGDVGGGHYTAHARNLMDGTGRWFEFNDRTCTAVTMEEVQSDDAYILYYIQV